MITILVPEISYVEYILSKCNYEKCEIGKCEAYECLFKNQKFLILVTGYGKVNIASAIIHLVHKHECVKLVQIGTAGSINGCLHILDASISKSALQFDVDFTTLGYPSFTLPKEGKSLFNADKELIYKLKKACEIENVNYGVGVVGTSDSFVANTCTANNLNSKYGIETIDCECGSVGQIAYNLCIPFAGIKVISNFANNNAANQYRLYDEEAILICQKIILTFLSSCNC